MADPGGGLMRRLAVLYAAWLPLPRRVVLGALLMPLALGASPARAGGEASTAGPTALEIGLELLDASGAESGTFRPGEPITLRITVGNPGTTLQRLDFSSARTHDAIVRTTGGREVWRWSHGRQFAQMLSQLTLAPGESHELSLRWDPSQSGGAGAREGDYVAVGLVPALGAPIESGPVAFAIRAAE